MTRQSIDLYHFESEIFSKKTWHMIIESDFFYQTSELVQTLLINDSKIMINNISILTRKVGIYKKNGEYHLTNVDDKVKVILY
ncbi:hypothetical protein P4T49_05865 [Bacillus paranthracis]|uniref:hypothetical protein n=1 Tax=Bacillus paranthracis TaxID=2026186 RepID=UPI0022E70C7B|nr:hypothetical protein [Bacillus paranthracis]MED0974721.1 hypothetical protein [Bacillus paranthracis]MED1135002.1 hypothetical protein [Bacillus paranthracis]